MAGAFLAMGLPVAPWIVVAAYVVTFVGANAVQAAFRLLPRSNRAGSPVLATTL
jgi:hypothetical protein